MESAAISQKVSLQLPPPTEEDGRSDQQRLLDALRPQWGQVEMGVGLLRQLYPLCREAQGHVTATLVWKGTGWALTAIEPGDTTACHYGLAVDLGSTSVSMELIDLNTGEVCCRQSRYNRQRAFGDDVLTRIFYGKDNPEHLAELQQSAVDTLAELMEALWEESGVKADHCPAMVLAGNTIMINLLLGLDGYPIFLSPYAPVASDPGFVRGGDLGLPFSGLVYLFPAKANYMGGDIVSGMIATGIARSQRIQLFFDIGTNGELVAGCRDFLVSGAGAAGPALEGGVIRTGMCAAAGAVDRVHIENGAVELSVIGGGKVAGICGSGIVDMIAELFLEDIIDFRGLFQPERSERVERQGEELAFRYADADETVDGVPRYFYQSDIEQFLATKAAAHTMVAYMLAAVGMDFTDVEYFYVAGAFGAYLDPKSAVTIGLYPDIPMEQIRCVGNSSLAGCRALLTDRSHLEEIGGILERMEYIQYGAIENFVDSMHAAAVIPHMNTAVYPSVERWHRERRAREGR